MIGRYPTAIQRIPELSRNGWELWVKRDDQTSDLYGGNKVRKLERIVPDALAKGARRIVTFGAAGSHHVLATTLYGSRAGLRVAAVLTPQRKSEHAEQNLRAALGLGLEAWPAQRMGAIPAVLARHVRRGDYVLSPGGSSVTGTLGYVDAAAELAGAVRDGTLPAPDIVVVALGSGGTAAGLVAGLCLEGLPTKVLAVRVVDPWMAGAGRVAYLAKLAARRRGAALSLARLRAAIEIETQHLGDGYGVPTAAGERASAIARDVGLALDPVYTAKTFAAVLERRETRAQNRVLLYWHTFSSAPLAPLLLTARPPNELPKALRALLVP